MKFLIASDIHGSAHFTEKLKERFIAENAYKLILLGDIYNHGPRNPFPEEYAPQKVAEMLNSLKDRLIVVKGNCDSDVDTLISEFDFVDNTVIVSGEKTVFCTHGHVYNKDNLPSTRFDALVYGHYHTGFIKEKGNTIVANPGSTSLPKGGTPRSFILLDEQSVSLYSLEGDLLDKKAL